MQITEVEPYERSSDDESWENAKKWAAHAGHVPNSFSTSIRTLIKDQFTHHQQLRPVTKFQMARLMRVDSFLSMLYHASKELRGEALAEKKYLTLGCMMDLFEPLDMAAMIAAFVQYRKSKKILQANDWNLVQKTMSFNSQFGAQVGVTIPAVGPGIGLILSTFHYFAHPLFFSISPKEYKNYMRHLNQKKILCNQKMERETWGCTVHQIASMILTNYGFGVDVSHGYTYAVDTTKKLGSFDDDPTRYRMKMGYLWIECLYKNEQQPIEQVPAEFYPSSSARERLEQKRDEIEGGESHWLNRGRDDIGPDKTPALYPPEEPDAVDDKHVPPELKDVFSLEEITKMEEDDFDELIDHMDLENEGKVAPGSPMLSNSELEKLQEIVD